MPIPTAQELDQRITLQTVLGGPYSAVTKVSQNVQTFARPWAKITQVGSGELGFESQEERSQRLQWEIWIRYLDGVSGLMQIVWKGRTLVQTGTPQLVTDLNNRRWWVMMAQETIETSGLPGLKWVE